MTPVEMREVLLEEARHGIGPVVGSPVAVAGAVPRRSRRGRAEV
jgi:hypothetical protein